MGMPTSERGSVKELKDYQQRLERASEIQPGDFLDEIEPNREIRGPRGGRYRYEGDRMQSRVERCCWIVGGEEIEAEAEWRPLKPDGFRIYTRAGRKTLPGNLADLTSAIVRRPEAASKEQA
jgi:hypothetical protein